MTFRDTEFSLAPYILMNIASILIITLPSRIIKKKIKLILLGEFHAVKEVLWVLKECKEIQFSNNYFLFAHLKILNSFLVPWCLSLERRYKSLHPLTTYIPNCSIFICVNCEDSYLNIIKTNKCDILSHLALLFIIVGMNIYP